MKKSLTFLYLLLIVTSLSGLISAGSCVLDVTMINQDPFPAVPGDYVEVAFQINGVENPDCGQVVFSLSDKYPLSFDPGFESTVTINAGTFTKDYSSFLMVPYKVRIDEDALEGDTPIEVSFSNSEEGTTSYQTKEFNLNIEDVTADFEIFIKDYDYVTNTMTLEILNIADSDIEALTLEIPKQDKIDIKGANRNILGDLDSNEYTTADFEAVPNEGEIQVNIHYTDRIGVRRKTAKTVLFNSNYFLERKADEENGGNTKYIIIGIIIIIGIYLYFKKKKKEKHQSHASHSEHTSHGHK